MLYINLYHDASLLLLFSNILISAASSGFGNTVTNVEISTPINDVCMIQDRRGDTGLMMVAAEETRIQSFYLPSLGPAPKWCSFLDTITEELEESDGRSLYTHMYRCCTHGC